MSPGNYQASNRRAIKNTAFLYVRMLFLTAINLYTVRITLEALGAMDYGIYNVVASVVASLSFLNGSLTSASQRYFSYHLGEKDYAAYQKTFSLMMMGFIIVSLIILAIGEILGIFFINDWLEIPRSRIPAAKWVYQTAILSFVLNLLIVPYSSSLVANEKMNAFAYIGIIDGILKMLLVFMLMAAPFDRLIYYGVLTLAESFILFLLYWGYCHMHFTFCRFKFVWDKALMKELTSYTGWNLFGSVSSVLNTQGQNILLNLFFGPLVNTAKGIADKISNVIHSFSSNILMAISPQIIKSYAAGDIDRTLSLSLKGSKISYFLLVIISLPLIACMDSLLAIWLGAKNVDATMVGFSQLTLVYCLVTSLEYTMTQCIRATGKIRNYQIKVGVLTLAFIPVAAIVLLAGASAVSTMMVLISIYILVQLVRVVQVHKQLGLDYRHYNHEVTWPILRVTALCIITYWGCGYIDIRNIWFDVIVKMTICFVAAAIFIWIAGLNHNDKLYVAQLLKNMKNKFFNKKHNSNS